MMAAAERVLVVEDDREINALLAEILRDEGFAVTSRMTVAEAIAHVQRERPDLVVADYRLPDGLGTDVCQMARSLGIPTIVVSAYPVSLEVAMESEVEGWIGKPFEVAEVVRTVRRILAPRPG